MEMEMIRQLVQDELAESIKLSEFAFQYELSSEERAERLASFNPDDQWGYFIDGKLVAKMTVHPMNTWINGKAMKFGGVASVATWPEYRRRGMVSKLLVHALHVMRKQGQTLACLHPFEFSFYRKFGWETYIEYKKYELEAKHLPHHFNITGRVERTGDRDIIKQIYEQYAVQYNGMLHRTDDWWENRVWKGMKGSAVVAYNDADEPAGYLLYHVADSVMRIHEFVSLNEQARASLWKFIANHDSMIRSVTLKAPADDPLPFLLHDPRFKQETIPYFMARVVDAEAFLTEYKFASAAKETRLALALQDPYAAWNQRLFHLYINKEGAATVEASGSLQESSDSANSVTERAVAQATRENQSLSEAAAAAELSCDIQTFTTMMIGYQSPQLLHATGKLKGSEEAVQMLTERLTARTPYLMDYY